MELKQFLRLAAFTLAIIGLNEAFQIQNQPKRISGRNAFALQSSATNYLESLSQPQTVQPQQQFAPRATSASPTTKAPAPTAASASTSSSSSSETIAYGPLGYFSLNNLASKGPRATKDWGQPEEGTRKLADDGSFRVGSWYCTEGGWPSPNPKAHTEIFYVLEGHGCLGDADGSKHYFGPGDTVIIPKGHTGRWDIYERIHKVWAVNDHNRIEETSDPIRVQVDHYHDYFAPQYMASEGLGGNAKIKAHTCYDVGPTSVGFWKCAPGNVQIEAKPVRTFFYMLEGILFLTDGATGAAYRCERGDTVMLPAGWHGQMDVVETAKKLWTTAKVE